MKKTLQQQRAISHRIPTFPSDEEISKLMVFAQRKPNTNDLRNIVHIALFTGLRASELINLRWADVNFEERSITISPCKSVRERLVSFSRMIAGILIDRRNRQPPSDYVLGIDPRRIIDRVLHQLTTFSGQIGSRRITLYGLRHAFANRWVNSGGEIASLVSILGHKSISTIIHLFYSPSQ